MSLKCPDCKRDQDEPVPVIDLKHAAYDYLCDAALKSKWIPEEYTTNCWLYDCAQYLEKGHPAPIPEGLLDLLAIIHRDGGHYIAEHGIDKAINDAKDKVWAMLAAARSEE